MLCCREKYKIIQCEGKANSERKNEICTAKQECTREDTVSNNDEW